MIQPLLKESITVETLLREARQDQGDLSAVERYARVHEAGVLPAQQPYYQELMPATAPGPGQQYAFEVDLDRCTACKSCVTACHNLNGLNENESWRTTGLLLGGNDRHPFQQTITTACHHCLDPACSNGCPAKAYEKDAITGIVKHLDDQCIGCKYCMLTCPYDAPKYSVELGIVRKCDMCTQRLGAGEAPACVQACPSKAIRISLVDTNAVIAEGLRKANTLLPGTPHPEYTQPTTRYVSKRAFPSDAAPADVEHASPAHGHPPLVAMLTLTQMSVGGFLMLALTGDISPALTWSHRGLWLALLAFFVGNVGMVSALFHLGRPQYAFRALLGLRSSWLSREILAFSLFMGAAAASVLWFMLPLLPLSLPPTLLEPRIGRLLAWGAAITGLVGVFTSVMVYHVTRRPCWHVRWSGSKFYLTTGLLGSGLGLCLAGFIPGAALSGWVFSLTVFSVAKLGLELFQIRGGGASGGSPVQRTAWLLRHPLRKLTQSRLVFGIGGGLVLPALALISTSFTPLIGALALLVLILAEGSERLLFFKSMTAARMPGNPTQ